MKNTLLNRKHSMKTLKLKPKSWMFSLKLLFTIYNNEHEKGDAMKTIFSLIPITKV